MGIVKSGAFKKYSPIDVGFNLSTRHFWLFLKTIVHDHVITQRHDALLILEVSIDLILELIRQDLIYSKLNHFKNVSFKRI